jgi:hypothetical protein
MAALAAARGGGMQFWHEVEGDLARGGRDGPRVPRIRRFSERRRSPHLASHRGGLAEDCESAV